MGCIISAIIGCFVYRLLVVWFGGFTQIVSLLPACASPAGDPFVGRGHLSDALMVRREVPCTSADSPEINPWNVFMFVVGGYWFGNQFMAGGGEHALPVVVQRSACAIRSAISPMRCFSSALLTGPHRMTRHQWRVKSSRLLAFTDILLSQ